MGAQAQAILLHTYTMTYQCTQDFGDGIGGKVYRAQRKVIGHRMLAEEYKHVPKQLLWLLPNPINIDKYQKDPMLVHEFCCWYTPPLEYTLRGANNIYARLTR